MRRRRHRTSGSDVHPEDLAAVLIVLVLLLVLVYTIATSVMLVW